MLFETPYRQIVILVAVAAILAIFGFVARKAPLGPDGWHRLDPSPMHWFGLVFGCAMLAVLTYIRLFVGSSRDDADRQMLILTVLILSLAAGMLVMARSVVLIRKRRVSWRDNYLSYRMAGAARVHDVAEISSIRSSWLGALIVNFSDGDIVEVDEHAKGVHQMITWLTERRPDLFEEDYHDD